MRLLVSAIPSLLFAGATGTWLLAGNPAAAQSPTPNDPASARILSRDMAARIIVAAIGSGEETIPIELGQCAKRPNEKSCGLFAKCAPTLSIRDGAVHSTGDTRGLFQQNLIESVVLRHKLPIIGYEDKFVCYYEFTLAAEAAKLIRQRSPGGELVSPSADVVAYRRRFSAITGVFDKDDESRFVEYSVTYEPTLFAKALSSTSLFRKHDRPHDEIALLSWIEGEWKFVNSAR